MDREYRLWRRKNVTVRGIKESPHKENGVHGMMGPGLYTCPLSNKQMAKQYGKLYLVVGARPKNPYRVNNVSEFEILRWKYDNDATRMKTHLVISGYDGLEIKGREMVLYVTRDIRYFATEEELRAYYDNVVK